MIHHVMSNWGDDAVLKDASSDDPVAAAIQKFRKINNSGYNYVRVYLLIFASTLSVHTVKQCLNTLVCYNSQPLIG